MAITIDGAGTITGLDADGISSQPVFAGNVLQVVRATDATLRNTTSTSFVDTGLSVTITPKQPNSAVILIWSLDVDTSGADRTTNLQITDSANTAISGAENATYKTADRLLIQAVLVGYDTPGSTTAKTYKSRFSSLSGATQLNQVVTGQLFAIEVAG